MVDSDSKTNAFVVVVVVVVVVFAANWIFFSVVLSVKMQIFDPPRLTMKLRVRHKCLINLSPCTCLKHIESTQKNILKCPNLNITCSKRQVQRSS